MTAIRAKAAAAAAIAVLVAAMAGCGSAPTQGAAPARAQSETRAGTPEPSAPPAPEMAAAAPDRPLPAAQLEPFSGFIENQFLRGCVDAALKAGRSDEVSSAGCGCILTAFEQTYTEDEFMALDKSLLSPESMSIAQTCWTNPSAYLPRGHEQSA